MSGSNVTGADALRDHSIDERSSDDVFVHARSVLARRFSLTLLMLGDSVPWGASASSYRACFPLLWAAHLRAKHDVPVRVVNATLPGRTTVEGRGDARVGVRQVLPDVTVIAFGANDQKDHDRRWYRPRTWRPGPVVPSDAFRTNLTIAVDNALRGGGGDIVLVTPAPLPTSRHNEEYRQAVLDVAARRPVAVADVAEAWERAGGDLLAADGHPNDRGHRVYADTLIALGL